MARPTSLAWKVSSSGSGWGETEADITPGTVTYSGTAIAAIGAGSYVITPAVSGFAATNYNAPTLVDGTLTINKATLTYTADAKTKVYNSQPFTAFTSTITGFSFFNISLFCPEFNRFLFFSFNIYFM